MQVDALYAPIRAYALECLGLDTVWNGNAKRQSYDWKDMNEKNPDGTPGTMACDEALQRCWAGHAQLVLSDLDEHGETPKEASERIRRQWRDWTRVLADKFTAKWKDKAGWPPALALSWIMFAGDWRQIAACLRYGDDTPTSGLFLKGTLVHQDTEAANRAAHDLMRAFQANAESPMHVIVRGYLNGQGPNVEISPFDLGSLEWAVEPNQASGAVLERHGVAIFTNVVVDAASLMRAFLGATPQIPQTSGGFAKFDRKAKIREIAKVAFRLGMTSKERNEAIREGFRAEGLTPPGISLIKEALKGTEFIKPR
jgi:hypothetical protein